MKNSEPQYEIMPEHCLLCFTDESELADDSLR